MITKELEKALYTEFGSELGEEMIIEIVLGKSVDNAIQTVLARH